VKREKAVCSECGKPREPEDLRIIDGLPVCLRCLYGDTEALVVFPVGRVINDLERSSRGFGTTGFSGTSRIELLPSQRRFLYRIDEERHLTILYYLHEAKAVRSIFQRGLDGKEVGVFASRTPDRLTPIAVTDVELERVEGTTLYVRGLDAVNGSPVLDIKLGTRSLNRGG
jgi:tRNA (Thr-GGU) A37 N-methylase